MSTSTSDMRNRKPTTSSSSSTTPSPTTTPPPPPPRPSLLRRLLLLTPLLLLPPLLSHLITDSTSYTFHLLPPSLPSKLLHTLFPPPQLLLTPAQLTLYNGTAFPTLPLLLSLNGTIYDVSSNPTTYGKGGGYNIFVGADCTRGFVTGCFGADRTHDLRGVEEMFLEEDAELDMFEEGRWAEIVDVEGRRGELGRRAAERRERARRRVGEAVQHWVKFFEGHETYRRVGRVVFESLEGTEAPVLCENAKRKRPGRA
ncbi:heme/steroid binding domain protein [Peziza echinospora]|nr:heme/steroid binding domain protein [Peziza echinospora]